MLLLGTFEFKNRTRFLMRSASSQNYAPMYAAIYSIRSFFLRFFVQQSNNTLVRLCLLCSLAPFQALLVFVTPMHDHVSFNLGKQFVDNS